MDGLRRLSLVEARNALAARKISAVELTKAYLEAMEAQRGLNAFITETPDHALKQAQRSDDRLAKKEGGKLEGLPLGIKDLFCTKGVRTTAASKILGNFVPPYESTVTQNLLDEGAVFLGKLNMDEFAMGSANLTSAFGHVVSPLRSTKDPAKELVPGGSSGGSAVAVAARMALATTASDTGGSIRQPASFTGIVGIKPTYGRCSRYGMVAFGSSLDQAGPLARNVRDAALMLSVMASHDPKDSTSLDLPRADYLNALAPSVKGLTIGLPEEYFEGLSPDVMRTMREVQATLERLGATFKKVHLAMLKYALPSYYVIAPAEASSNLARYDGVRYGFRAPGAHSLKEMYTETRHEGFGLEVKRRIMIGTFVLSKGGYDSYYTQALKVREKIKQEFAQAFTGVDLIMTPTATGPAFGLDEGEHMSTVDMYLNDVFTVSLNMAGLPGISIPGGRSEDGLPLGVQLIGPRLSEQRLFDAAAAFEDETEGQYLTIPYAA